MAEFEAAEEAAILADTIRVASKAAAEAATIEASVFCYICTDHLATHVWYPCGHYGICDNCYLKCRNDRCHICRRQSHGLIKVHKVTGLANITDA